MFWDNGDEDNCVEELEIASIELEIGAWVICGDDDYPHFTDVDFIADYVTFTLPERIASPEMLSAIIKAWFHLDVPTEKAATAQTPKPRRKHAQKKTRQAKKG